MTSSFNCTNGLCISLLLAGSAFAGVANAQTANDGHPASADTLEEVTVTAQRRAERQQDVPISLSALSSRDIAAQAIVSSDQLQVAVPALSWSVSQFGSPYVRGIGAANVLPGSSTSVPIYVDGALLVSPQQSNFGLYGVERVEVLKGPQGTLFGRNATGGVVSIVTRDPTSTPTADFEIGYGSFKTATSEFYGSTRITDTLSSNLSASFVSQGEGWGTNLVTGKTAYRERNKAARWKLKWAPNENTSWVLALSWAKVWSDKNTRQTIDGGYIGRDGSAFPGWWNTRSGEQSLFDREVVSATLNGAIKTAWGDFVSITNYADVKEYWSNDVDAVGPQFLYANYNIPAYGFTQEFRLVSTAKGNFKWQTGVYFQQNRSSWDPLYVTGTNLGGAVVLIIADLADSAQAAYGDVTWTFMPDSRLTLGARYSVNNERVSGQTVVNGAQVEKDFQQKKFGKATWRAVLDHNFTPDVMVYGSVSTGFNQGTFNSTAPGNPALQPETVTAYEIGAKSEWLNHRLRLNADVYYEDFRDLQTQIVTQLLTRDANVGRIKIKGFELELLAVPTEGLTLGMNYNFNDAKYADFSDAVCVAPQPDGSGVGGACDATGNQVRVSPKHALGATVTYDLQSSVGLFSFSANDSYKSKSYWDYGDQIANQAHSVVNATIRYAPSRQKWAISLRGRNLTNSTYWTEVLTRAEGFMGTPAEPRAYSANFEMHF